MDSEKQNFEDCELSGILSSIQNSSNSTLSSEAIDFLNKLAYFDLSDGIDDKLCRLIISRWSARSDPESTRARKNEAKSVLQVLLDNNILCEVKRKKSNEKFVRMSSNLQAKILTENQENVAFIIDLTDTLKSICIDWCGSFAYRKHMFHIHTHLKALKWPGNTIALSVYLVSQLFCNHEDTVILDDVKEFFNCASNRQLRAIDFITVQMIQIYEATLSKSRKVLQPSDIINVTDIDGDIEDIRLDGYGGWILNQIRIHSASGLDCDHAITSVAENSLYRLQKHARFCNKPDDVTLDWIIAYRGREWHSFVCFAALACYQMSEWLTKLCRTYIRKLRDLCADECTEKSQYSLKDLYHSWDCLRDLVKTSRVQQELISALCDEDGLELLSMNFGKCATTLESKEYFIKYQAQTVIELLTPLLVNGRSEIIAKLLKIQAFWNFITLVMVKHPFISERYKLELENDILCACEVYLDLLVAVCNRKDDTISDGFLISFLMEDFLATFTLVIRGASEIRTPRQRDTCMYYLFTVMFTLFTHMKLNGMIYAYLSNEDIRKEIDEYSAEDATFEVQNGCLQEYKMHIESFYTFYSNDSKFDNVTCLLRKMLNVREMSF